MARPGLVDAAGDVRRPRRFGRLQQGGLAVLVARQGTGHLRGEGTGGGCGEKR